jgi:tetratricopeptide (TPR) repeat protein
MQKRKQLFIGRDTELALFRYDSLQKETPDYQFISIFGASGIGKTTLLENYAAIAAEDNFKPFVLMVKEVGNRHKPQDPDEVLDSLRLKLAELKVKMPKFEAAYTKFLKDREKLNRNKSPKEMFSRGGEQFADFFGAPDVAGKVVGAGAGLVADKWFEGQEIERLRRHRAEISNLSKAFIEDLNQHVSRRMRLADGKSRAYRLVLVLDEIQYFASKVPEWLLEDFVKSPTGINSNIVIVIAGRMYIDQYTPQARHEWTQARIHKMPLNGLSDALCTEYLTKLGLVASQIETALPLIKGYPYLLYIFGETRDTASLGEKGIARFVEGLAERDEIKVQLVKDLAFFSKPFVQSDLRAFGYLPINQVAPLYAWLIEQPVFEKLEGGYLYREAYRDLLVNHLHQSDPTYCYATRQTLADYYRQQLEQVQDREGKDAYKSEEWLTLALSLIRQYFCLNNKESYWHGLDLALTVYFEANQDAKLLETLQGLKKLNFLTNKASKLLTALLESIEGIEADQAVTTKINFLLEELNNSPTAFNDLKAKLYGLQSLNCSVQNLPEDELNSISKAIQLVPDNADYHASRGQLLYNLKRYEEALVDRSKAIELESDNAGYYRDRGVSLYELKRFEESILDFTRAIELDDNNANYHFWRSSSFYWLEQYEKALTDDNKTIELEPNNAEYYKSRGVTLNWLKRYEEALSDHSKAIELEPNNAEYYKSRGVTLHELKRYEEALSDTSRAIELEPDNAENYLEKGAALYWIERYEESLLNFNQAIELVDNNANYYFWRGLSFRFVERYEEALADANKAIILEPDNAGHYRDRGVTLQQLNQLEESLLDLNKAVELVNNNADYYFWRGLSLKWLKRYEEAMTDFSKAIELEPHNASHYRERGMTLEWLERYEEALVDKSKVIELEPGNSKYYRERGTMLYMMERYEETLADDNKLVELEPNNPEIYRNRAMSLRMLGRWIEARVDEAKAQELEQSPDAG